MKKLIIGVSIALALLSGFTHAEGEDEAPPTADLEEATNDIMVADPADIIKARKSILRNSAARRAPIVEDFADISEPLLDLDETFNISSEPGANSPSVIIARYMSTTVNFVDAYGKPWPIRNIANYMGGLLQVNRAADPTPAPPAPVPTQGQIPGQMVAQQQLTASGSDGYDPNDPQAGSFTMSANKQGFQGNLTVFLKNRSTPITIILSSKSGVFHKVATIKIDEVGPQTDLKKVNRGDEVTVGTQSDGDLNNALYGVAPPGSQTMVVEGGEGRAWLKGEFLYMQTPLSVFSPKVIGASHANGRYRAYKMAASTLVMASNDEGKTVSLKIKRNGQTSIFAESQSGNGR